MTRLSISAIHIFIHIYQSAKPVWKTCDNSVLTVHQPQTGIYCKCNQSKLLEIIMVDKDNDVVMFNPKNNKEITKTHICKGVRADS